MMLCFFPLIYKLIQRKDEMHSPFDNGIDDHLVCIVHHIVTKINQDIPT